MKNATKNSLIVNNKRYNYYLNIVDNQLTHVKCDAANLDQDFLNEDISALIVDLPNLILAEKKYAKKQNEIIRFRLTPEDKRKIECKAVKGGYKNVSSFLRDLALN